MPRRYDERPAVIAKQSKERAKGAEAISIKTVVTGDLTDSFVVPPRYDERSTVIAK